MNIDAKINETWKKLHNKERFCMFGKCNEKAINSHVFQKNGILRQMSENNHLIQLFPANAFKVEETGLTQFKKIGINDAYSFKGFCEEHDTKLFYPIEAKDKLDLFDAYHQALFSYRGLCQEIRRKGVSLELINEIAKLVNHQRASSLSDGFKSGIRNLTFFKEELESAIITQDFSKFYFSTIEIPKINLCISVPLNVGDLENPNNLPYDEWKKHEQFPRSTSFINIFPLKSKSYFIGGFHKDYPCNWTKKKLKKLSYSRNKIILKELSDLIVLRLEFWTMSPKLFRQIPQETIRKYKLTFSENIYNHSPSMKTKINLFKNIKLTKEMKIYKGHNKRID
ncbi:MAG: hypothetical protein P9L97_08770 [Candidatus Tenebribacter davisii]|nr:hypothetical protein [Candidatus Tenebribacter davisii]